MTRTLRIVRTMPFFDPATRFGGSVAQARATTLELVRRGHQVSVITSDLGIPEDFARNTWVEREGYRIFYATARGPQRGVPYPAPRAAARACAESLREADIALCNVGLTLWHARVRKLCQRQDVAYVYNAEGALCPTRLQIKRTRKRLFLRSFERKVLGDAAAVQALTHKDKDDAIRQGADPRRVHVIPNGIEPHTPSEAAGDFRDRLGIPADAFVVLFLGRLHEIKGTDLLLRATAPTMREHASVHLVFAGPDEGCRAGLEQDAQRLGLNDRVKFTGNLSSEETRAALTAANLFALTSHTEGLPIGVLEAAAAGLPLVITEPCHVPEVAEFGAGHVTPVEVPAIAEALRSLITDDEARAACRKGAIRMASDAFSLTSVVDRLETLYRDLARR